MNSFAYIVANKERQVVVAHFQDFEEILSDPIKIGRRVQSLINEEPLFKQDFEEVLISYGAAIYSLVPEDLYQNNSTDQYLMQVSSLSVTDKIGVDQITFFGCNLVFALDKGVQFLFELHFPKAKIYHALTTWLHSINRYATQKGLKDKLVFVNVEGQLIQVGVIDEGRLLFVNHFSIKTKDDFRYYIFLTLDQFDLSPEVVPIYLSGNIDQQSDNYKIIHPYIQYLHIINDFGHLSFHSEGLMLGVGLQRYFDLAGSLYLT